MRLRNLSYRLKVASSFKPSQSYIVSIGNLSVGGSGKTPLTEKLMKDLLALYQASKSPKSVQAPLPFAILSRGYKSRCDLTNGQLIFRSGYQSEQLILPAPSECGDEPCSLAKHLPGIWFGIGRNRRELAFTLAKQGVKFFILDDGFQHLRLERSHDVVLLDAEEPFANGHMLPRGPLREPLSSLKRADLVVLYPVKNTQQFLTSSKKIESFTKAPVVGMHSVVTGAYALFNTQENLSLEQMQGALVAVWCGIARPERFVATVVSLGCQIVAKKMFADHERPSKQQLIDFAADAFSKGARYMLCTEKDAIKWIGDEALALALPSFFLRIELRVIEGAEKWKNLLQQMYQEAFL